MLLSLLGGVKAEADPYVKVDGRQLVTDFDGDGVYKPFMIKGVGYSPFPIGRYPSDWGWPDTDDPRIDNILDDPQILERDFTLLQAMHVNTIRLWAGNDIQEKTRFPVKLTQTTLDIAEHHAIKVIAGFSIGKEGSWECIEDESIFNREIDFTDQDVRNDILGRFLEYVADFKDHPAILFWAIGNENNLSFGDDPDQIQAFYSLVNEMAELAHKVEGEDYHPVALLNGDLGYIGDDDFGASDDQMDSLDIWGANVYRGESFGSLFDEYKDKSKKPFWISEFGVDAWHSNDVQDPEDGHEDQATQAIWVGKLWDEIVSNSNVTIGGAVMEYSDEWWKPNEWFCGDNSNECNSKQNHFGSGPKDTSCPADGKMDWHPPSPDNFFNAEWWGIMAIAANPDDPFGPDIMKPRKVYYELQNKFKVVDTVSPTLNTSSHTTNSSSDAIINSGDKKKDKKDKKDKKAKKDKTDKKDKKREERQKSEERQKN